MITSFMVHSDLYYQGFFDNPRGTKKQKASLRKAVNILKKADIELDKAEKKLTVHKIKIDKKHTKARHKIDKLRRKMK